MSDISDAFFRQRRNLLGSSLVVLFVNLAAVRIEKLNLLGNELVVANPVALSTALGVALTYFLIRYVQYMHEIEDKGFVSRFHRRVERYLQPYVLRRELRTKNTRLNLHYGDLSPSQIDVDEFVMFSAAMPPNTAAASFVAKRGGLVIEENDLSVSNRELFWPALRAATYIIVRTRLATDYVLPLGLAVLAYSSYSQHVRGIFAHGP